MFYFDFVPFFYFSDDVRLCMTINACVYTCVSD